MKHLRLFETETSFEEAKENLPDPWVALENDVEKVHFMENEKPQAYTIKVSANGDGCIIVNKGLDNCVVRLGNEKLYLEKLPSDQDIEVEGVKLYAYNYMDFMTVYVTQSEEGTYENVLIYVTEGDEWEEIMVDTLTITNGQESGLKEQVLYYTEGENQILTSDTPIKNVIANCNYVTDEENDTITSIEIPDSVTSIGNYAFYKCSSLTSVTIPNSVTSIDDAAFIECENLTSINIPDSVTTIGGWAFSGCSSLTSINIPDSVTSIGYSAFSYCDSLTSIEIPNSVTSIGYGAFDSCSSLTSVTIPDSVTYLGEYAFQSCRGLTSVTIGSGVTSINGTFYDCTSLTSINIPDSVTIIYDTFCGGNLETVNFGENSNLTTIQDSFNGIPLKEIEIPKNVTEINNCFAGCMLNKVTLYDNANYFDTSLVFMGNGQLDSIGDLYWNGEEYPNETVLSTFANWQIHYKVNTINVTLNEFINNYDTLLTEKPLANFHITDIDENNLPNNVILYKTTNSDRLYIGYASNNDDLLLNWYNQYDEYGLLIYANELKEPCQNQFEKCYYLSEIHLPDSITSIAERTFYNCSSLTGITIPYSVTSIGNSAFSGCSSLTGITIPDSVTSIGDYAFSYCTSLPVVDNLRYADTYLVNAVDKTIESANIKDGTKWIGDSAFEYCYSLTGVTIPDSVTSIGNYAFYVCSDLTSVTIPNSVTSIGDVAFGNCSSLTSINIPDSVTSINNQAFYGCTSLTLVTYSGTTAQWNAITKGTDFNYGVPETCVVHCTDGDIAI